MRTVLVVGIYIFCGSEPQICLSLEPQRYLYMKAIPIFGYYKRSLRVLFFFFSSRINISSSISNNPIWGCGQILKTQVLGLLRVGLDLDPVCGLGQF